MLEEEPTINEANCTYQGHTSVHVCTRKAFKCLKSLGVLSCVTGQFPRFQSITVLLPSGYSNTRIAMQNDRMYHEWTVCMVSQWEWVWYALDRVLAYGLATWKLEWLWYALDRVLAYGLAKCKLECLWYALDRVLAYGLATWKLEWLWYALDRVLAYGLATWKLEWLWYALDRVLAYGSYMEVEWVWEHSDVPVEEKNMYIPDQRGCNELTILDRLPMLS